MGNRPTRSDEVTHGPNCAGLLARAIQQLETCANKRRDGGKAGPSPLKSILVGSTLVDRPAAVPAFPFIAGPAEGTLRACSGRLAFIPAGFLRAEAGRPASPAVLAPYHRKRSVRFSDCSGR